MLPRIMRVCLPLSFIVGILAPTLKAQFDIPWKGFETAVYPEGINPWGSRTADFNGDGFPDLASVSWNGTAYLSILLNDQEGGFLRPETYSLVIESLDLEIADFDRDGDLDIATSDTGRFWEGNSVSLYLNDGKGIFSYGGSSYAGNTGPSGITSGDFDGDGWIDVAVAHDAYINFGTSISVLSNNNGLGFQVSQTLTLTQGTRDIDCGDLDNDGDLDLAVAHETNQFTLVFNDSGQFTASTPTPGLEVGSIPELPTTYLADVDSDGDLDVFFSNRDTGGVGNGAISLWRNLGDGKLDSGTLLSFGTYSTGGTDITTADVTGDGVIDILTSTPGLSHWFLFEGDGQNGFEPPRRYRCGEALVQIHAEDLDLDGDRDVLALAEGSLEICVYDNPGTGIFSQPIPIDMVSPSIAPAFSTNLQASDIDRDGDHDLIVGYRSDFSNSYGISVRRNMGDGRFETAEIYAETNYPKMIRVGDLDGDDDDDLAYLNANNRLILRFNDGNGDLSSRATSRSVSGSGHFVLCDVDVDGDLDVVAASSFDVVVLLNNGTGSFGSPIRTDVGGYFEVLNLGDFDGDSIPDLLTSSGIQGYPEISVGIGNGRFEPPNTVPTGRDVRSIAVGDVNGDGFLDFGTIYNLDEKGLSIRRGRGDGNFFVNENYYGSYGSVDHRGSLQFADVDDDGDLDALATQFSAQEFSLWLNQGDGRFDLVQRMGVGEACVDLVCRDFNGDGSVDVALACEASHERYWYAGVVLIEGNPSSRVHHPSSYTVSHGTYHQGDLSDLQTSDDRKLGFTSPSRVQVDFEVYSAILNPTSLECSIESSGSFNAASAQQEIALFDFVSGRFETVDRSVLQSNDSTVNVTIDVDANRFLEPLSGRMIARVQARIPSSGKRRVADTFAGPQLTYLVDQFQWTLTR